MATIAPILLFDDVHPGDTLPELRYEVSATRMVGSVFPGDTMALNGIVEGTDVDASGCGFASVAVTLSVDGDTKTTCVARIALPRRTDDNPWARRGDQWQPSPVSA